MRNETSSSANFTLYVLHLVISPSNVGVLASCRRHMYVQCVKFMVYKSNLGFSGGFWIPRPQDALHVKRGMYIGAFGEENSNHLLTVGLPGMERCVVGRGTQVGKLKRCTWCLILATLAKPGPLGI